MNCRATIQVGDQTVGCFLHEGEHEVHQLPVHRAAPSHITIEWDDEAPGARPPKYDMVCRRCADVTAERDRFLKALERISRMDHASAAYTAEKVARRVLDGGDA